MKIAYLLHFNLKPGGGVYKKVIEQLKCWKELGIEVKMFLITRNTSVIGSFIEDLKGEVETFQYKSGYNLSPLKSRFLMFGFAKDRLLDWNPDIVYTREDRYYPSVGEISRKLNLVIEINSLVSKELLLYSKVQWFYNLLTHDRLLTYSKGLVFVTNELSKLKEYSKHRKSFTVIPNGIDLSKYRVLPPKNEPTVNIVFIGGDYYTWHGVDKIISMAEAFPNWKFHIIGIKPMEMLKRLPNLNFYGFLQKEEYEEIFKISDCAIGTLALHREGAEEACPLKTREYLAYGLPVIIGYKDTDFPNGAPFLLKLPNTETNVKENLNKINEFVLSWKGKRVEREMISNIDLCAKEKLRIDFFKSILGRSDK